MEKALARMVKNDENIQPQQIKFLLDSKETIKLLMKRETEGEMPPEAVLRPSGTNDFNLHFLLGRRLSQIRADKMEL
jgi:hypothetical protein